MDGLAEFLNMGGYAGFIWPSYIAVAGVLLVLLYVSVRALRTAEADLNTLEASDSQPTQQTDDGAAQP